MNKKEACKKVIQHQDVDPIPFSIKFTVEAKEKLIAKHGEGFDPILDTGSYVVASHTNNGWEEIRPGYFKDYYGVIWNKTADRTLGIVEEPIIHDYSFGDYQFPDPDAIPVYDFIRADQQKYPEHYHMVSIGFTLFERAWALIGMEELLMGFAMEPEFVKELFEHITAYNIKVIKNAAELGIDAVHFGDDWGSQLGPMISPDMWREFVMPPFTETCKVAKDLGLQVSLHCCGNVEPIMEDIWKSGVDVFDPFQPEAMDIWALREKFRNKMAFWGGLSVQQTFPYGSPEEVRQEAEKLLKKMAPGGGYILAPAHSLTGDIPLENIEAFLDVANHQ